MAERVLAEEQLERILYLLPAAAGEEGVPLAELAASLGVRPEQVLDDVGAVTARDFYHPAGSAPALSILLEGDRLSVWSAGDFRRPVRLAPREALALGLGLRALAADEAEPRRSALVALARELEAQLATAPAEAMAEGFGVAPGGDDGEGVRALLRDAATEGRAVAIGYLKPGSAVPDERIVHPYSLVFARGEWYALAYCTLRDGVRAFRLDRILAARPTEQRFHPPADFDPAAYLEGGRVYRADEDVEVMVRFSPRIARWIVEQGPAEIEPDGSALVRFRVADPRWLVRHVLHHGLDAEIVSPPEFRTLVREAAARVLDSGLSS